MPFFLIGISYNVLSKLSDSRIGNRKKRESTGKRTMRQNEMPRGQKYVGPTYWKNEGGRGSGGKRRLQNFIPYCEGTGE